MQTKIAWLGLCLTVWGCGGGGNSAVGKDGSVKGDAADATAASDAGDSGSGTDARVPYDGGVLTDVAAPDGNPPASGPLSWPGVYDADGLWDLSGPIGAQRSVGDVVVDLLVDEIVDRAGVPSLLRDRARGVVHDLIATKVKAAVDQSVPAALKPDSELMRKLGMVLASTEVKSTIDVGAGRRAGDLTGLEELRSFTFGWQDRKSTVAVGDLLQRTVPLVTVGADWDGKVNAGPVLAVDQHAFELRFGRLVLWVVDNVLLEQGAASLSQTAASLINCAAITSALLDGKTEFSFGVSLLSYKVSASTLQDGCQAATGMVKDRALGLFDMDAGVELGGEVEALDDDADRIADRLKSKAGYGGIVTKWGPAALAPRVTARFEARRRRAPRTPAGIAPDYADMSNTMGTTARLPLRGRVFQVMDGFDPASTTPFAQVSQQELPREPVTVTSGSPVRVLGIVTTDGEGYIDQALDVASQNLPPGNHLLQFQVRGRLAGVAWARLLAPGADALVVRSDVDLTYLDTDFMSTTGKLNLLIQRAAERTGLPAMDLVYRALRRGAGSADDVPVTFLSGSPNFFKMVLEEKAHLDGIAQDGVVLKPFKDIIASKLSDVDLGGVVPALEEQVGYKLTALLRLRLEVPADTREILMGDDSEADAVAYLLYHQLTSRQLTTEALMARLDSIGVDATWKALAAELAPKVVAVLPARAPVSAIYINRTGKPNPRFPVADWTVPLLTRAHDGAWPLVLDLFEEKLISGAAVMSVKTRLKALGRTDAQLATATQAAVAAGFLRTETVTAF